jgi:hypothetical protein
MDAAPAASPSHTSRADLALIAIVAVLSGVYGWAVFALSFHHDGLIGLRYNAPGTDYMVYYTAIRSYFEGTIPSILDPAAFTARLNHDFAGWLSFDLQTRPWVYPPIFLVFLLPFGLPGFAESYALFMGATFAVAAVAMCFYGRTRRQLWFLTLSLALSPAASSNVAMGQNGFLTAAIILGGFGLIGRRDIAAGAILGLMSYKPQFALMIPVALIAARNWRVLGAAAASATMLALASAWIFGAEIWREWINWSFNGGATFQEWLEQGRLWGWSVYACAALLGVPPRWASAIQAAAAVFAAFCIFRVFSRPVEKDLKITALLAATLLAAPHMSHYDTILLAAAGALLFCRTIDGAALACSPAIPLMFWLVAFLGPPRVAPIGLALPLLLAGGAGWIAVRPSPQEQPAARLA